MKTGGALLVAALEAQGVDRVFSVPGESYLVVLDALHDASIENIVARHEGGAAMMAEADGKLTGRPGIAFVTRGPGATNAASGVHVAKQDSTPMILFVGQIGLDMDGREAFQEMDYRATFSDLAKWVVEIRSADRIGEVVAHAFHVAMSGRPGPVVIALPEDMLRTCAPVRLARRIEVATPAPAPQEVARFAQMLGAAQRPMMVVGGSRWDDTARDRLAALAARWHLPVAASFRRHGLIDHASPCYAGDIGLGPNPALVERIRQADLLILLGARFSENPSQGFSLLDIPEPVQKPGQKLVHIHPGAEELGRIYHPDLAINAVPGQFLDAIKDVTAGPFDADAAHGAYRSWSEEIPDGPGAVGMRDVMRALREGLPDNAVLTNGAGNYAIWLHRFWRFARSQTYLGPTSGSMGYGLPAAIAAKARHKDRPVICLAGDGCFQMTMQEFGTAAQIGAAVVVILLDNGAYGTIRMHQERDFPGRVSGTTLRNPDFAALARAYGGHGETVLEAAQMGPALARALAANGPALIHVRADLEAITPAKTLTQFSEGL